MASAWSRRTAISRAWRSALREEGLVVYGFGEQKTPEAFRNACNRFIYVENLLESGPEDNKARASSTAESAARKKDPPRKARKLIASAIGDPDGDGWENLGRVGSRIQGAQPDFDPRSYGCANLSTLVERSGGFEIRKDASGRADIRRKASGRNRRNGGTAKSG